MPPIDLESDAAYHQFKILMIEIAEEWDKQERAVSGTGKTPVKSDEVTPKPVEPEKTGG